MGRWIFLYGQVGFDSYRPSWPILILAKVSPLSLFITYKDEAPATGTGTKFVAYLSPSPTFFKHKMNIDWPIMKNKLTNDVYSLYST